MSTKPASRAKRTATKSAAKPAAKPAAATAAKPSVSSVASGTRGPKAGKPMPRWSTDDVQLLVDTVAASRTAKEAFAKVAELSGRSAATVQAKYYQLQKKAGRGASRRRGRPAAAASTPSAAPRAGRSTSTRSSSAGNAELRDMTIDALVSHAREVKSEIDRRRRELDDATKLFK